MNGGERREKIVQLLTGSDKPITGKKLSETFGVSRQVIVQDIALLRAQEYDIISMSNGYVLETKKQHTRVFKVCHTDDRVEEEMNLIVDFGGSVEDVFIYHKIYGIVKAPMTVRSRKDVKDFLRDLSAGKSTLLSNVTSGYHYHTVAAPTEVMLDLIQKQLEEHGFLAKLQDYEPIDFWKEQGNNE